MVTFTTFVYSAVFSLYSGMGDIMVDEKAGHCLSRESFAERMRIGIARLTNRARFRAPGEYILIRRLEYLCHLKGIALSDFFLGIERMHIQKSLPKQKRVRTNARLYYEVLDIICKRRDISDYSICILNGWDYSNFRREKLLALSGIRKTFSIMKLFRILSALDISLSYFFLCCEKCLGDTLCR